MYRIGLDYHMARSVLCILDGEGTIVKRQQVVKQIVSIKTPTDRFTVSR